MPPQNERYVELLNNTRISYVMIAPLSAAEALGGLSERLRFSLDNGGISEVRRGQAINDSFEVSLCAMESEDRRASAVIFWSVESRGALHVAVGLKGLPEYVKRSMRGQLYGVNWGQVLDSKAFFGATKHQPTGSSIVEGAIGDMLRSFRPAGEEPKRVPVVEAATPDVFRIPRPGRPWTVSASETSFTFVESVRATVPDDVDNFHALRRVGEHLAEIRGGLGYGGMLLSNKGAPLSPIWVSLQDGVLRPDGRIAASGWPSHRALGLPDVLDLGAIDGRNIGCWDGAAPQGLQLPNSHLYVGDSAAQFFEMSRIAGSVVALDTDARGDTAGVIEYWGHGEWRIALAELTTGVRRYLHAPSSLAGYETIQFAPGGEWLLLSEGKVCVFINASTGAAIQLTIPQLGSASWWPAQGAACVALLLEKDDGTHLASLDCATARFTQLGPIEGPASDLPPDRRSYSKLTVHPTKHFALVGAQEGPSAAHQSRHGSRNRVAILDLTSRRVELRGDPFLDDHQQLERQHDRWHWSAPMPHGGFRMHERLEAMMTEPRFPRQPSSVEYVGRDAHDLTVHLVKGLLERMDNVHCLRPEVLRAYEAARHFGLEERGLDGWIREFSDNNHAALDELRRAAGSDPQRWPEHFGGLAVLANALELVATDSSEDIDWANDRNA